MIWQGVRPPAVLFIVLACPSLGLPFGDGEGAVDLGLLAEFSIEPSSKGAREYLSSIRADPAEAIQGRRLINDLSDESFRVREAATRAILQLAVIPTVELGRAASSDDLEVARRAQRILRSPRAVSQMESARQRPAIVAALCRTIERRNLQGLVPDILAVLPDIDGDQEVRSVHAAIRSTATKADLALLRRLAGNDAPHVRAGAISGIEGVLGPDGIGLILPASTTDESQYVRLVAASSLARLGRREALAPLVGLLDSADQATRAESLAVLRGLTGVSHGLNPHADAKSREVAVAIWRRWLAAEGGTARIRRPLVVRPIASTLAHGLLVHFTFDVDKNGQIVDSSGSGRHGQVHNTCEHGGGLRGGGLSIKGAGHHGASGGHATLPMVDLSGKDSFAISMWVNEHSMTHHEGEAYVTFGVDRGVGIEDAIGISHFNDDLWFRVGQGSVRIPFNESNRKKWVHYALVYSHGRVRAYQDGRAVGDSAGRVGVVGSQAALGRHWWGNGAGTSTRFVGELDDVRVYGRALLHGELKHLASP